MSVEQCQQNFSHFAMKAQRPHVEVPLFSFRMFGVPVPVDVQHHVEAVVVVNPEEVSGPQPVARQELHFVCLLVHTIHGEYQGAVEAVLDWVRNGWVW